MNNLDNEINILAWNVRGVISSGNCLSSLLDNCKCDIAIISEHKLTFQSYPFLESMHSKYSPVPQIINSLSSLSENTKPPLVCLLIKKDLMFSVSEIKGIDNDRIIGVELRGKTNNTVPLFIFGVYLPANNDSVQYKNCVDTLCDLEAYYSNKGRVIISGDMNAKFNETSNGYIQKQKSKILTSFINDSRLIAVNKTKFCSGPTYSFEPCKSTLD